LTSQRTYFLDKAIPVKIPSAAVVANDLHQWKAADQDHVGLNLVLALLCLTGQF